MIKIKNPHSELLVSMESNKIAGLCVAIQSLCKTISEKSDDDIVLCQLADAIHSVAQAIRESADCISADIT